MNLSFGDLVKKYNTKYKFQNSNINKFQLSSSSLDHIITEYNSIW